MTILIHIVEITLLIVLGGLTGYLALLSVLSLFGRRTAPPVTGAPARIAVVIPAHDEERVIGRTLRSVANLDYPADCTETFVIADNCTDGTAAAARNHGATVLERTDDRDRGKGFALRWAFDSLLTREPRWDGFVVIDADSSVSRNFLRVMNAHLRDGAEAIQASDMVEINAGSWSSEITRLGFTLYNFARPLGRGVLGGSAGLRGNGMCFSARLLSGIPWNAFGVTEDLHYGLNLLLRGVRVRFAADATVIATMPAAAENAETQRARWEQGRVPVKRAYAGTLLRAAVAGRSFPLLDAWIDLLTPPFVQLMTLNGLVFTFHVPLWIYLPGLFSGYIGAWAIVIALGLVHVLTGLASAGADARLYLALFHVPRYALWKLFLRRKHSPSRSREDWVRTTRETAGDAAPDPGHHDDNVPVSPNTQQ